MAPLPASLNIWASNVIVPPVTVWTSKGDIPMNASAFGSAQAAAIGASFGNGAAQFGQNPANPLQMGDDGNLVVDSIAAGRSPSAIALDKIVSAMSIPVGGFDIANRGISIVAAGACPNVNAKTVKIIVNPSNSLPILNNGTVTVTGGTTIAAFTASGAGSSGGWQLQANIFKVGAAGSNTQIALHEAAQAGSIIGALQAPTTNLTLSESAVITVVVTANAATAVADIVFNFGQIFAMN